MFLLRHFVSHLNFSGYHGVERTRRRYGNYSSSSVLLRYAYFKTLKTMNKATLIENLEKSLLLLENLGNLEKGSSIMNGM